MRECLCGDVVPCCVTGKMSRRPASRSTGVRTSHHGPS
jgi:hypothetical protein